LIGFTATGASNYRMRRTEDYQVGGRYYRKGGRRAKDEPGRIQVRCALSPGPIRTAQRKRSKAFAIEERMLTTQLLEMGPSSFWNLIARLRHQLATQLMIKRCEASSRASQAVSRMRRERKITINYATRVTWFTPSYLALLQRRRNRAAANSAELPPPEL
jgi:hypothetical protein